MAWVFIFPALSLLHFQLPRAYREVRNAAALSVAEPGHRALGESGDACRWFYRHRLDTIETGHSECIERARKAFRYRPVLNSQPGHWRSWLQNFRNSRPLQDN